MSKSKDQSPLRTDKRDQFGVDYDKFVWAGAAMPHTDGPFHGWEKPAAGESTTPITFDDVHFDRRQEGRRSKGR